MFEKLREIIVEQLGADAAEIKPESAFIDDLGADSLDMVELIMAIEEEFGFEVAEEDAERILTVKDAEDYIKSQVG